MSRMRRTARESRSGLFATSASEARQSRPLTDPNFTYSGGGRSLVECPECFNRGGHEDWCARGE